MIYRGGGERENDDAFSGETNTVAGSINILSHCGEI